MEFSSFQPFLIWYYRIPILTCILRNINTKLLLFIIIPKNKSKKKNYLIHVDLFSKVTRAIKENIWLEVPAPLLRAKCFLSDQEV